MFKKIIKQFEIDCLNGKISVCFGDDHNLYLSSENLTLLKNNDWLWQEFNDFNKTRFITFDMMIKIVNEYNKIKIYL